MIDHAHRCIYIHQRKTAGMSIISAFGVHTKSPDWHIHNDGVLSPEWIERPDYFVFSSVRNPFDRLVSGWKYLQVTRDRPLRDVLLDPPSEGAPFRHLTRPQAAILVDQSGKLVTDDLIRFESLQEDFDRICDRIGKRRTKLGFVNTGTRDRDYRSYFDAETRKLAEDMFRDDLEAFGYSF